MRTPLAAFAPALALATPALAQQATPSASRSRPPIAVDGASVADEALRPLAAAFTASLVESVRRDTTLRLHPAGAAAPDGPYLRITSAWRRDGGLLFLEWAVRDGRTSEPRMQRLYEMRVPGAGGTIATDAFAREIVGRVATFVRLSAE